MIPARLTKSDLESVYDAIAEAIDAVPPEKRELFLAKLAFVLADLLGDARAVEEALAVAARDLG
ncbi:MAG: DUF2783 domain-containing protein [Phyllobacteriaceae bacterium]|nr:DUF2783 domain-containing protein [Phyllobacteriaceae bacterium]